MNIDDWDWAKWSPVVLIVVAAALFLPTLTYQFTYDDNWYIVKNRSLDKFEPARYFLDADSVALPSTGISKDVYRPLSTVFYAGIKNIFGLSPGPYRLVSIILHTGNVFMLFLILSRFIHSLAALVASLTFLVHPIQVESVVWISQQSILICGAGVLASFIFWIKKKKNPQYQWLSVLCYGIALLAKETALAFPVILMIYSRILEEKGNKKWIPFAGTAAGYLVLRHHVLGHWGQSTSGVYPFWESIREGAHAIVLYGKNIFWPFQLNVSYPWPQQLGWESLQLWIGFLLILGLIYTFAAAFKKRSIPLISITVFLVFWAPHSGAIQLITYAADRFMYLPLLGVTSVLAFAIRNHPKRWIFLFIPLVFFSLSWNRKKVWSSEVSLWTASIKETPQNSFSHSSLGEAYYQQGRIKAAEKEFMLALKNKPTVHMAKVILERLVQITDARGNRRASKKWSEKLMKIRLKPFL